MRNILFFGFWPRFLRRDCTGGQGPLYDDMHFYDHDGQLDKLTADTKWERPIAEHRGAMGSGGEEEGAGGTERVKARVRVRARPRRRVRIRAKTGEKIRQRKIVCSTTGPHCWYPSSRPSHIYPTRPCSFHFQPPHHTIESTARSVQPQLPTSS